MTDYGYEIDLMAKLRPDSSIMVTSKELPLFSYVLKSPEDPSNLMLALDAYLRANVPHYVELKRIRPGCDLFAEDDQDVGALPTRLLAVRKGRNVDPDVAIRR